MLISVIKKILSRHVFKPQSPVIVNSIPKAGTNLLLNIVLSIPNLNRMGGFSLAGSHENLDSRYAYITNAIGQLQKGEVAAGHCPYFKEYDNWLSANKAKQVFIYRDPRDVTVSLYKYIMNKVPQHAYFNLMNDIPSDNLRLLGAIEGIGAGQKEFILNNYSIPNIKLVYEAYQQWLDNKNTFAVSYESLLHKEDGLKVVREMLCFLGYREVDIEKYTEQIYFSGKNPKKSHTYRKGKAGTWREEYQKEHIRAFNDIFPRDLLTKYGYSL